MRIHVLILLVFTVLPFACVLGAELDDDLIPLQHYQPSYLIMGTPDTKIQVSFKVRALESTPIYLGYTQLMMWELFQPSPYFSDLNYNPDIFYRLNLNDEKMTWLDFGFFEHESNGKGGILERSWNRSYLRFHNDIPLGEDLSFLYEVKAWVPYLINNNNSNIIQYRGLYEVSLSLTDLFSKSFDVSDLILRLYPGGPSGLAPWAGGQELTLRMKIKARKFLPYFVFQVFHGYGENLLNYQANRFGLRAGIGI